MGLMDLVNKGKCLIGLHEGEWRAASPTECTFTRTCVRCRAQHSRIEHPWGDWYFAQADACEQLRQCPRCAMHEQRLLHSFGEAQYVAADSCDRQEQCQRCQQRREVATLHHMTEWRQLDPETCQQVQQCSRCRADGAKTRIQHSWGDWQHSNARNGTVRVCRRCGELQTETITAVRPDSPAAPPAAEPSYARSSPPSMNPALVAHWRHTEIMSSGDFSLVTDTHLVLQPDGRFRRWSQSTSSMGKQTSAAITGTWHTEGDVLHSRGDGGDAGAIRFTLQGNSLFFPDGGSKKLWERVR